MFTIFSQDRIYRRNVTLPEKELAHIIKHLKDIGYDISKIHINYAKFNFVHSLKHNFNINISWLIVQSRADKWLEEKGLQLIQEDLEKFESLI